MAVKTVGRAAPAPRRSRGGRTRRAWLVTGVLAVVAVVFTVGVVLGAGMKGVAPRRAAGDGSAAAEASGVPVGHPLSRAGAIAAAADYAQALAELAGGGDSRLAAGQAEVFAPSALGTIGARARADARRMRATAGLSRAVRHAVVGSRLLEWAPPRARVALWSVHVAGTADETPSAWWMTEQLTMSWDGARWRVVSVAVGEGPVPAQGQGTPSAAAALAEQLELMDGLRHAG